MGKETQRKGDIAVTHAIAEFTALGLDVSVPISENLRYDLLIDDGTIHRIQVKYTTNGTVALRSVYADRKTIRVRKPKAEEFDWLYAFYNDTGYLLEASMVDGKNSIKLKEEHLFGVVAERFKAASC